MLAHTPQSREEYSGPEETKHEMTVTTDNKWHNFRYRNEVPSSVLQSHFPHLKAEDDYFFKYREFWYHLSDFSTFEARGKRTIGGKEWDGYAPDTFFSGVLLKLHKDGDMYMIGRYYS